MNWATVSFWSCFCWLYRVSPSLAAKNIINLISVLITWWCPRVESSLVLLEEGVCFDQCILLAKLCYPLPCFILYSKAKFACYSRYLLTSCFCIPVPYNEKDLFWVLVLEGLVWWSRRTCAHFLLQGLQNYNSLLGSMVGVKIISSKRTFASMPASQNRCRQCPWSHGRSLSTHTSAGDSRTLTGKSGSVSCGIMAPFSWVPVGTSFSKSLCLPSPVEVL